MHVSLYSLAGVSLVLVLLLIGWLTGTDLPGISAQVLLVVGVAVANYRLHDLDTRVKRIEDHLMSGSGDHPRQHKGN